MRIFYVLSELVDYAPDIVVNGVPDLFVVPLIPGSDLQRARYPAVLEHPA